MRVDDELAGALRTFAPLFVVTHFNHAKEITPEAREACARLVDHGIPVENQAVLMRRVNSSARAIKDLMQKCLTMRVRPYYLHQMDVAEGLEHLRTPLSRGVEILRELRGWTSGLAVPHLAVDLPGGRFALFGCGLAGAIGCVLGSIPAYYLGAYGGRPLIVKYGRYVLLSAEHLDQAERFFARRGDVTVFVARLLPVVRTFIAFPAGVARMPMGKFVAYTFAGSLPWCLGLAWVGMKLGEHIDELKPWFHRFDAVLVAAGLVAVAWFVRKQLKARRALS